MTSRRTTSRAAALLLLLPLLTGCGGGSYCERVHAHQDDLTRILTSDSRDRLLQALPAFRDLADAAPEDVADDWQLVIARIQSLQTALQDAGVDPATYDRRHPPSGVTAEQRRLIDEASRQLGGADTLQSLARVQQEVLDVCHTPLSLG